MKLADLNKNNISLGNSRTIEGDSFEFAVPMSQKQRRKAVIDSDNVEEEEDPKEIEKFDKTIDILSMANSWAPKRDLPDIRRPPNTANLT